MKPETWKAVHEGVVGVWSVLGPVVGIFIGAFIANRNQRSHWVADNKKLEFQELITALTRAFSAIENRLAVMVAHGSEEQRSFAAAEKEALITISDRIFIQEEVARLLILKRWQDVVGKVVRTRNLEAFSKEVGEMKGNLVFEAKKLMG